MDALTINFAPVLQITDEQFFQLCQINKLIRFERNANGTLLLSLSNHVEFLYRLPDKRTKARE
jgi:Uma2 family endonuclease